VETEPQIEAVVIDFLLGLPPGFCKTLESRCQFPCAFYLLFSALTPSISRFKIILTLSIIYQKASGLAVS
jgi:hypothetical protein